MMLLPLLTTSLPRKTPSKQLLMSNTTRISLFVREKSLHLPTPETPTPLPKFSVKRPLPTPKLSLLMPKPSSKLLLKTLLSLPKLSKTVPPSELSKLLTTP